MSKVLYLRGLPDKLKKDFKDIAHRREDPMTEVVEALMMMYVADPKCIMDSLTQVKLRKARLARERAARP